jgi:hypothetical protein
MTPRELTPPRREAARLLRLKALVGRGRLGGLWPDVAAFAAALLSAVLAALLLGSLHGCGGGVGGEGTGSFASGPVTGFGSIIVNDVRYDDSRATLVDDDGGPLPSGSLALGAMVQVSGGAIGSDATDGSAVATAYRVQVTRAVVGPVGSVDAAAGRLVVLGQTVRTTAGTVLDARLAGGLATLKAGDLVEVHGAYDASARAYVATRLALAADDSTWRVRGPVGTVDATGRTVTIGSQTYGFPSSMAADALRTGAVVQVQVQSGGSGPLQLKSTPKAEDTPASGEGTELRGRITLLASATRFAVGNVTVDASTARVSGVPALGAELRVSGTMQSGVLLAREVRVEAVEGGGTASFSLRGPVNSLDMTARRLVVRGTTVSYARSDLVVEKGTLAQLAVGRQVRIDGVLSADRTVLEATRLRFDD